MALKLRRDVLDHDGLAARLRSHLAPAPCHPSLRRERRRQHDPAKHAGPDNPGELHSPVPAQQTVDLLERQIGAREMTDGLARRRDGRLLIAIPAGEVEGIGALGRGHFRVQENRQRADAAGELGGGVERPGQVVGDQAQDRHATACAAPLEGTTFTSRPRSRARAISTGSARSSVIISWTAVSSQILQNAAAPNLEASARRTILRAAEIIARFIAAASSDVSLNARPLIAWVPMKATSTLRLLRKLSPGSPRTVREPGRTAPPRQRTRNLARCAERLADAEIVGDRSERNVALDARASRREHRRTAVENDARAGMKSRSRSKPDRFLFRPIELGGDRGLWLKSRLQELLNQRPAVRALEIAALLQMLEIAADCGERDADRLRQFLDRRRAAFADVIQHEGPALRRYELWAARRGHGVPLGRAFRAMDREHDEDDRAEHDLPHRVLRLTISCSRARILGVRRRLNSETKWKFPLPSSSS